MTNAAPSVARNFRAFLHVLDDDGSACAGLDLTRYATGAWAIEVRTSDERPARPVLYLPPDAAFDEGFGRLVAALADRWLSANPHEETPS